MSSSSFDLDNPNVDFTIFFEMDTHLPLDLKWIHIIVFYADFLVPEALLLILMVPAVIAELSLGVWLLLKSTKIPEMKY